MKKEALRRVAVGLPPGMMNHREKEGIIMRKQDDLELQAERELRKLRITGTLSGMSYLISAISWAVEDPAKVRYITKEIYMQLSTIHSVEQHQVERTIRTAIKYSWENGGRDAMDQMAGYHLEKRPTNSEFIALIADKLQLQLKSAEAAQY